MHDVLSGAPLRKDPMEGETVPNISKQSLDSNREVSQGMLVSKMRQRCRSKEFRRERCIPKPRSGGSQAFRWLSGPQQPLTMEWYTTSKMWRQACRQASPILTSLLAYGTRFLVSCSF